MKMADRCILRGLLPSVSILISAVLLAGCAATVGLNNSSKAVTVVQELGAPDVTANQLDFANYRIGPNDVLLVEVLQAPELKREGVVDAGGNFSLPVIGNVLVGGKTPLEVEDIIENALRGTYLVDPNVTVNISEARSQMVTIDGAVSQPGMYPVLGRMTLQQAIASARGANMVADLDSVVIFRDVQNEKMAALFSLNEIRSGRMTDPYVYGNDVIVVGESAIRTFFRDLNFFPRPGQFAPVM